MTYNKYGAEKVFTGDGKFDSKAEYRRWLELQILERAGEIKYLERQPKFQLIPAFRAANGKQERAVMYTADFRYEQDGKVIVEDVKSVPTRMKADYIIRRKLLQHVHPHIYFREVA